MTQEKFALVPRGGLFEGQIAVVGETRIDGTVLGSLQGPGNLVLGSHARVEGRIECETVSSRGAIIGPVVVRKLAHLGDGARVEGDLVAPVIEVDGDVIWNGKARVGP
jgi:cytoskeletal protein CcmA (bactofilin family)